MIKHRTVFIFILIFAAAALLLLSACRRTTGNTDSSTPHGTETESSIINTSNQTSKNADSSENQKHSEEDDLYELRQEQAKGQYYFERQKENDRKAIDVLSKFYNKDFPYLNHVDLNENIEEETKILTRMLTAVSSKKLDYYTEAKPIILYIACRETLVNKLDKENKKFHEEYQKSTDIVSHFFETDSSLEHEIEIAMDPMVFGEWPPVESNN